MKFLFVIKSRQVLVLVFLICASAPYLKAQNDSIVPAANAAEKSRIKSIGQVVGAKSIKKVGFFTVHQSADKLFFEIPDSLLSKDLLVVSRFIRTPAGLKSTSAQYGGELINSQVWKLTKRGDKIDVKVPSFIHRADEGSEIFSAFENSNMLPILASFDIKAIGEGKRSYLIDVTDFFEGEIPGMPLPDALKKKHKVASIDKSRSYLDSVRSYPINVEIPSVKTYKTTDLPADVNVGAMTLSMNTSILLLPERIMTPRLANKKVGYFQVEQTDFSAHEQRTVESAFIHRWRLEPIDSIAYLNGELVEPKKQIVFYIDPATPAKWVPYLIQGINDWNRPFEAAGFKNAIIGKVAPTKEEDPDFSTEDARYSLIRYFASPSQNAYGPRVIDPRSGEILESHVGWYHNAMTLVKNWYFIQTAASNPKARGDELADEEMGELIRFVSSHEIGHALGLMHNFAASNAYSVDSLRSQSFTNQYGTAPSIMDYARFNYIAQPGDGVTNFYPKIGIYDDWSVKWGYTWFGNGKSKDDDKRVLDPWVAARDGKPEFFFGRQGSSLDPRSQSEDLGNDAVLASALGIKNLKVLLPNIEKWTYRAQKDASEVGKLYDELFKQYKRYLNHVAMNVAGLYENYKTYDQPGAVYSYVPKSVQVKSAQFIIDELFLGSDWIVNPKVIERFDFAVINAKLSELKVESMAKLTDNFNIARMIDNERKNGLNAFTVRDLFSLLNKSLFGVNNPLTENKRSLQRMYIERLTYLITLDKPVMESDFSINGASPYNPTISDWKVLVKEELLKIKGQLKIAQTKGGSAFVKAHNEDLLVRISKLLK